MEGLGFEKFSRRVYLEEMATEGRIAQEMRLINQLLQEIGKASNMVTYGKNEVKNAVDAGAVKQLLVIDELLRNEDVEG